MDRFSHHEICRCVGLYTISAFIDSHSRGGRLFTPFHIYNDNDGLSWVGVCRVIRAQTLSLRTRPYIDSARVAGASSSRIIFKHIAPNVIPLGFYELTMIVGAAIITESGISFLGFGDPTQMSWGMMINFCTAQGHTFKAPWWLLPPGFGITLLSMAFYLIGRAFDEIVNPRLRKME
jgi:ABC-type dipeptide/oligopeptide/nickel transport systems, permease components